MKELMMILACATSLSVTSGMAVDPGRLVSIDNERFPHYHEVTTTELKQWIDSGKAIVIVDARTKAYDDGLRMPGAKMLPFNSSLEEVSKMLPAKDAAIIVYCSNQSCPQSKFLADRLIKLGYTDVYKYSEGIQGWIKSGFQLDNPNKTDKTDKTDKGAKNE